MATGNKFGWHSGTLTCKDAKLKGDLYVQDDIVFSDVSAGVLGITGGIDMQSTTSAIGIDMGGTFTTAAINIDGTLSGRAIRIGTKGKTTDGSLAITAPAGTAVDEEPANNYLVGVFSKVASTSAATSNDELRSAWFRTRVDTNISVGSNDGWGYGVCGIEAQLKFYGGTTTVYSWQNSAVWAQLESQAATTTFHAGSYTQCVLANIGLTSATLGSGAVIAGVTINSNTATLTNTGNAYYGLFITDKNTTSTDFTSGIWIADSVATTGITLGNCTTGISLDGDYTDAIKVIASNTIVDGLEIASACTKGVNISGACTTGFDITGAVTRGIRVGTHDWGVGGATMLTITATDPLLQVAGKVTANNVSGVYACSYNQLALTSATQNAGASMFASWNELYITPATATITLAGAGNFIGVGGHCEITGTVTTSTGNIAALNGSLIIPATLTNNGVIAGVQVDMILNNGYTNSGIIAAYAIGEHTDPGQNKIPIGFYMPYNACKRGMLMGAPYAGGGTSTGLKILTDDTTWSTGATVGIYFDDGGSALTAWGEGFTVGQAVLTNSTVATQTGLPYTAFFYLDVEANVTGKSDVHWANVMTSFIVGSTKTLDGCDVGCSSLHTSCDINGTLASGSCLSNLSFGGNSPGSISGEWVCMDVRPTTGNFTHFLRINNSSVYTSSQLTGGTKQYLKVLIGAVEYQITLDKAS